jgi:hypothetical protein
MPARAVMWVVRGRPRKTYGFWTWLARVICGGGWDVVGSETMETMIVLITSTILGGIGWWLGEFVGIFTAFMVSIIGTAVGVYWGRWIVRTYLP